MAVVENLNALMRLTLYGLDPETKQRIVLRVPSLFPVKPPQVSKLNLMTITEKTMTPVH